MALAVSLSLFPSLVKVVTEWVGGVACGLRLSLSLSISLSLFE